MARLPTTFTLALAVLLFAALLAVAIWLKQRTETTADHIVSLYELSAHQRMLGQRIANLVNQDIIAQAPADRDKIIAKVAGTLGWLNENHQNTLTLDRASTISLRSLAETDRSLNTVFEEFDRRFAEFVAAVGGFIETPAAKRTPDNVNYRNLVTNAEALLESQEQVVAAYRTSGRRQLERVSQLERWNFIAIAALGIIALLIGGSRMIQQRLQDAESRANALNEAKFRSLSEATPIGIFLNDDMGDCTYTNPRWQEITGLSADEALGSGWTRIIYAEDRESTFAKWTEEVQANREFSHEFRVQRQSGEIRWVHSRAAPIRRHENDFAGYVGTTEDVTSEKRLQEELMQSEERFALAIRGTDDGIWDWDLVTQDVYYSPRFEVLLGYAEGSAPRRYSTFEDALHPDDRIPTHNAIQRHLTHREPFRVEYRLRVQSGFYVWFSVGGQAQWDADGKPIRMAGSIRDISERRKQEATVRRYAEEAIEARRTAEIYAKDLEERSEELLRSNKELEEFAYISSHDLQEPLRKIQAFGDRLHTRFNDQLGDQGKDYLERMRKSAERMQTLIQDLLSYSRATHDATPFAQIDLNDIVAEVIADLDAVIEAQRGHIEVGNLPTVSGVESQLRHLFQNLISNALKFHTPDSAPQVKISHRIISGERTAAGEKCWHEFRVSDNGIGIDLNYVDKIFEPFQRLHGRDEFTGTGIGLAVCRKVVDWHDGEIAVDKTQTSGTTFVVKLPFEVERTAAKTTDAVTS